MATEPSKQEEINNQALLDRVAAFVETLLHNALTAERAYYEKSFARNHMVADLLRRMDAMEALHAPFPSRATVEALCGIVANDADRFAVPRGLAAATERLNMEAAREQQQVKAIARMLIAGIDPTPWMRAQGMLDEPLPLGVPQHTTDDEDVYSVLDEIELLLENQPTANTIAAVLHAIRSLKEDR